VVRLASELARAAGTRPGAPLLLFLDQLPRENQPHVAIEVIAPGAAPLLTTPHRGLHTSLGSTVVVGANAFERRRLTFRVFHAAPGGLTETIGVIEVPIGELTARGGMILQGLGVTALELTAEPADGVPIGSFSELTPAPLPPPPDRPRPPPGR
jgi:hypothetical protein